MKKLLLLLSSLCVLTCTVKAQQMAVTNHTAEIRDTLHYYYNKYYFKTATPLSKFPLYKSAAATVTVVTHVGSKFENSSFAADDTLYIEGLEAYAARNPKATPVVPIHLYLCTLNVNGMPVLPAIDSVVTAVIGTSLVPIGGPLHNGTKKLTKDFAILFRNMSTFSGDTAHLLRTAGKTFTSGANPIEINSEGYGIVRYNGQFFSATNYTAAGFGVGTDYEFCVAPRVRYNFSAGQIKPSDNNPDDSIMCTHDKKIFTSTTTRRVTHRMYNLVEFKRRWDNNPRFDPGAVPATPFPGDSSGVTWHFLPEDARNYHLPVNSSNGQIVFYTDSAHKSLIDGETDSVTCFPGNEFRVRLHGMNYKGGIQKFYYNEVFTICTSFCGDDYVGMAENGPMAGVKVYPNPAVSGKTTVSGLAAGTEVVVYNVLGQKVLRLIADKGKTEIDLSNQAPGQYLLSLRNESGTRAIKILKQD